MLVLVVAGAIALFLASDRLASKLGSSRPALISILTTTGTLTVVGLLRSGPEPLGSFPAQTTIALFPRAVVSLVGASVLVGGIAFAFQSLQGKSAVTQSAGLALAGLFAAIVGASVALFVSCILGVGCI